MVLYISLLENGWHRLTYLMIDNHENKYGGQFKQQIFRVHRGLDGIWQIKEEV